MTAHAACGRLDALLPAMPDPRDWLSEQEGARLAAIAHERRRAQFLAARWQLRQLLASAEGGQVRDWSLSAPPDAPPAVRGRDGLHLSISHSGDWIACAAGRAPLAVDIEAPRRRRDIDGLMKMCCTPEEQALLRAAPDTEALFHELWTVKESWLKRRGEGVSPARLVQLAAAPDEGGDVQTWRGPGYSLALCATSEVRWWTQPPQPLRRWRVRAS